MSSCTVPCFTSLLENAVSWELLYNCDLQYLVEVEVFYNHGPCFYVGVNRIRCCSQKGC